MCCAIRYLVDGYIFPHEGIFGAVLRVKAIKVEDAADAVRMGNDICVFSSNEVPVEMATGVPGTHAAEGERAKKKRKLESFS